MDIFDYTKCYKLNEDFEIIKGSYDVFINYKTGTVLKTQEVLTDILRFCDGNRSMQNIYEEVSGKLDIECEVLKLSCQDVLASAVNNKLIYEGDTPSEEEWQIGCVNTIWIHVGNFCNLRCPFCYSDSGYKSNFKLEVGDICAFLSSFQNPEEKSVIISGGEPFCYTELYELLTNIRNMGFKYIQIITNGTTGEALYEKVLPLIDSIQFSLDGISEEINSKTRGIGNFAKTVRNIKLAKESGAKQIVVSVLPTTNNLEQLKDFPEFLLEIGVNAMHVPRFMPVGRGEKESSIKPDDRALSEAFAVLYDTMLKQQETGGRSLQMSFAGDWYSKARDGGKRISCGAGTSTISVNYDGNVYPCASLHKDQFRMGHISDSFESIMKKRDEMAFDLSVLNINSDCYDCKVKYFCGGNCRAVACSYGSVYKKNAECDNIIDIMEKALREY